MLKAVLRTAYFDFGAGILLCKGPLYPARSITPPPKRCSNKPFHLRRTRSLQTHEDFETGEIRLFQTIPDAIIILRKMSVFFFMVDLHTIGLL
jgi:hypothetical protein